MTELPRCRMYSEGTWFIYAFLTNAEFSGPKQFTFPAEYTIERVTEEVQKRLDELYVTCQRHVVFTRYAGSLEMTQGGNWRHEPA